MNHEETAKIVNALFEKLISINPAYRACWKTDEDLSAAKKEWVLAFIENNLTSFEKLKNGLKETRKSTSPFIPSPGQFIAWCKVKPEDINAPSLDLAYDEACRLSHPCETNKNWSHKAVRYAANKTGSHFLRTESISRSKPVFQKNYEEAIEMLLDGKTIDCIEHKKDEHTTNPTVFEVFETIKTPQEAFSAIRRMIGGNYESIKS